MFFNCIILCDYSQFLNNLNEEKISDSLDVYWDELMAKINQNYDSFKENIYLKEKHLLEYLVYGLKIHFVAMFGKVTNNFPNLQISRLPELLPIAGQSLRNLLFAIIVPLAQVDPNPQAVEGIQQIERILDNVNR